MVFWHAHHHVVEKKSFEPAPMFKSLRFGFLMAVKDILSIREDGLAAGGPPCGPWVWLNSATHCRKKEPAGAIFGDTNKNYVKDSNLFPGVYLRILFCFSWLVMPCTHDAPLPLMILFHVPSCTAQACLPLGYADASSHCPMRSHHYWTAWFELDATIWLHQIREDLCFTLLGCDWLDVYLPDPQKPIWETEYEVYHALPISSYLVLLSASVLPSYMGAHGYFSLKPSKCFGIAQGPEIGRQICLESAAIGTFVKGVFYCFS